MSAAALLTLFLTVAAPDAAIAEPSARLFVPSEAPLQPGSAFAASFFTAATGFALMMGSLPTLTTGGPNVPSHAVMFSLGFLLFNFGPNTADFLSGNYVHVLQRGLLRLGLLASSLVLAVLGPVGALGILTFFSGWLAWCVADVIDSTRASSRWAARMNNDPPPPIFPILKF